MAGTHHGGMMPDSEQERREAMLAAIIKIVPVNMHPHNKQAVVDEAAAAVRLYFEAAKIKLPSFKETKKLIVDFGKKADGLVALFNSMHIEQKHMLERILAERTDDTDLWFMINDLADLAAICSN
jgi:hypothetical protein